ncbi:DNA alkylation repair protein [Shewanella sp. 3_MG-2023]|uniref:DNA alkylation repair protein n=1 Tax=Shewanella sp. 3_MG-2023 TaxID=3062635 RepID=UPI0026E324DB|nr:DNA alkylation repair protein [Shewanella sp. 3_MG-2023]MDO6774321.1 DNA alkylation repair protein [Shewanella sp. 3_MG-2023]
MNKDQANKYLSQLRRSLADVSTPEKAKAMARFFNHEVNFIGAKAADIKKVITEFQQQNSKVSAYETLELAEQILANAKYTEEVLLAFGLLNKFVKRHFNNELLLRFEFWLEHYVSNWSHVDDLCIKTIYQFMLSRPELIETTQHWAHSSNPWCRRASCVVWVKFIKRKIGKSVYILDKSLIFRHCELLLNDPDPFVQKSVGWLLKVASIEYEQEVIAFIKCNVNNMQRGTIRYAIEKLDSNTRKAILSI